MATKFQIAQEIVNSIREKINEDLIDFPEGDPWDEEEGGAAWLDNEVGMATEFLQRLNPLIEYPNWNIYHTVQDFQDEMMTLSEYDLEFIRFFIVEMGGSSEIEFFDLREKSNKEILSWFKEKGFVFQKVL